MIDVGKRVKIVYGCSLWDHLSEKLKAQVVMQTSRQAKMKGVEDFLKESARKKLELLRKGELIEIGEKLELGVKRSMRKNKIIKIVSEHTIDKHIFEEEALDDLPIESTDMSAMQIELEKGLVWFNGISTFVGYLMPKLFS